MTTPRSIRFSSMAAGLPRTASRAPRRSVSPAGLRSATRTVATVLAAAAFLLAPLLARGAEIPAGAVCIKTTTIRASDGAIITHKVCTVVIK